jgi:transcription elongation factor GreA
MIPVMAETYALSKPTFERLKAELTNLTTHGRTDIARKIEVAREMGDLSENGDYHAAKEEQGKMEARIGHLSALLENAEIIAVLSADEVRPGCVVTITYEGDDDEERYLIGMIEEERDGLEVISPTSPLGRAVIGHKIGETVSFEAPTGDTLSVTVRGIDT